MSLHIEWDTARECEMEILDRETANEELSPAEEITVPYVVILGGAGGGALAVEGTESELIKWVDRLRKIVYEELGEAL